MMNSKTSKVKIKAVRIKEPGERQFFQIKLPADAKRIISVEVTATPWTFG